MGIAGLSWLRLSKKRHPQQLLSRRAGGRVLRRLAFWLDSAVRVLGKLRGDVLDVIGERMANFIGERLHVKKRGPVLRACNAMADLVTNSVENRLDPTLKTVMR